MQARSPFLHPTLGFYLVRVPFRNTAEGPASEDQQTDEATVHQPILVLNLTQSSNAQTSSPKSESLESEETRRTCIPLMMSTLFGVLTIRILLFRVPY